MMSTLPYLVRLLNTLLLIAMRIVSLLSIVFLMLCSGCSINPSNQHQTDYNIDLGNIATSDAASDVHALVKLLETKHYDPYLHHAKADHIELRNKIIGNWGHQDSIPKSQFALDIMKLLSLIEDGHTNLMWYSTAVISKRDSISLLPITIKQNEQGRLVTLDKVNEEIIIKTINGYNAQHLYQDALMCLAGNMNFKQEINNTIFFPVYLYLKNITPPFHIKYENQDIQTISTSECIDFISLFTRMKGEGNRYSFVVKDGVGVIYYNSADGYQDFSTFLSTTFATIKKQEISSLIVDIRNNSGGNSSINDLLLSYLTHQPYQQSSKRLWKISETSLEELESRNVVDNYGVDYIKKFQLHSDSTILDFGATDGLTLPTNPANYYTGELYTLVGPKTYSSANMLADALKEYNIGTIIGQPTGERTNDFGEQKNAVLPHSQYPYTYTIAYDIGANGNSNDTTSVHPDIQIQGDALDYTIERITKNKNTHNN